MKHWITYILLTFASSNILSQNNFDIFKYQYDSLLINNDNEKALIIAIAMKEDVIRVEKDSSIRFPISLRYIGNCFSNMHNFDSALYYWKYSLKILNKQNRIKTLDAGYCYLNIANLEYEKGNYKSSKENYLNLIKIYSLTIGKKIEIMGWR